MWGSQVKGGGAEIPRDPPQFNPLISSNGWGLASWKLLRNSLKFLRNSLTFWANTDTAPRGSVAVTALDLRPIGHNVKIRVLAAPLHVMTLGKLFTHMCVLSSSSITWYWPKGGYALWLKGLTGHASQTQWPRKGRWAPLPTLSPTPQKNLTCDEDSVKPVDKRDNLRVIIRSYY